jgi:hypothetical protein
MVKMSYLYIVSKVALYKDWYTNFLTKYVIFQKCTGKVNTIIKMIMLDKLTVLGHLRSSCSDPKSVHQHR